MKSHTTAHESKARPKMTKTLCWAAKRRLKAYIFKGHPYEEAEKLAATSRPESMLKRQTSDEIIPKISDSSQARK